MNGTDLAIGGPASRRDAMFVDNMNTLGKTSAPDGRHGYSTMSHSTVDDLDFHVIYCCWHTVDDNHGINHNIRPDRMGN